MSVTAVILPKLGLTMDEGKILAWKKGEGDRVAAGDVLFETETDKATMEVEAAVGGYLRRILVPASDALVPVTTVVAFIADTLDEPLPAAGTAPRPAAPRAAESASPAGPATADPADDGRLRSSPAARKRAAELGIALAGVVGTGPGGRISLEDVEAAARSAAVPPAAGATREPLSRMRRAIAERMTLAVTTQPQFSLSRDVDVSAADEVRRRLGVSWNDVFIAAAARALRAHPRLRARIEGDALVTEDRVSVGIAVALPDGLLVPVLHDADRLTLPALAAARAALEASALAGKLSADALSGGVLSVSNLGTLGVDRFTAIVNPPECAILAVGRVAERVVVRDGAPAVRPCVSLTLSVDHRVADGATAALFLDDVAARLERGDLPA